MDAPTDTPSREVIIMDKIRITIHVGQSSFAFDTTSDGAEIPSATESIRAIIFKYGKYLNGFPSSQSPQTIQPSAQKILRSKGKAERSLILQRLQSVLLPEGYFNKPRATHDVRSELESRFHIRFLSRKVSQALGDLQRKGVLSRVGTKGDFKYITSP
jgi:hypothetical protein